MRPPRAVVCLVALSFMILVLLPILQVLVAALIPGGSEGPSEPIPLFDSRHPILAAHSLALASGATGLSLLVGLPFAILIARSDLWGRSLFAALSMVPLLIPPYIHAVVWTHLGGPLKEHLYLEIHSLPGAIIVLSLAYFPFVSLAAMTGLRCVDRHLEEAAFLAHGAWATLRRITLPLSAPHILTGAVFVFIFSLMDFGVPDLLRVRVYPIEVFIQFSAFYNEKAAVLLSLPLMALSFALVILMKRRLANRSYVQVRAGREGPEVYHLGPLGAPALGFCILVVGVSVLLPVAVLASAAGPPGTYARALTSSLPELAYTLLLAASGALVAVILAFLATHLTQRLASRRKIFLELAALASLAVPSITLGVGLIRLWNRPLMDLVYGSSLIVVIGYAAHFIPFAVMTISSGLRQISPSLEEAAWLTTSRWSRVMARIVKPLMRPSLLAAFFIVFILSFGELGTTLLIVPPGRETLSLKIFNLMHYGAKELVAALCLIVVATILLFSGGFLLLHRRLANRVEDAGRKGA